MKLLGDLPRVEPDLKPSFEPLTVDSLLSPERAAPSWPISNLLPPGLTILAGAPKVGKSWLALQIARSVATGEPLFGEPVTQGPILYLALEDTPARLKDRTDRQSWPAGVPAHFLFLPHIQSQFNNLRGDGANRLVSFIIDGGYRLVVIDTLNRFLLSMQNQFALVSNTLSLFQLIAIRLHGAVILIDHHRKLSSADAITDILGSAYKGAVADTAFGLYHQRGKQGARLRVTGRDVPERTLALQMDWSSFCFQLLGEADELDLTARQQELLEALKELQRATLADLVRAVGQDRSNTHKRLQDMVNEGLIRRDGEYYTLH